MTAKFPKAVIHLASGKRSTGALPMRRLLHNRNGELTALFNTGWPAGGDRFGARVEFERIGAVLVEITKH